LQLPHSVHRSAYGWIGIPIVVIKNGTGPTVLLTAGIHGDEYEGQIALMKLCQELQPADVRGRIIILTAANFPAVIAGLRTSPIDDLNLNRAFPGDPNGPPTAAMADYIENELLPRADFSIDLHSGGSSLMYLPSALACRVQSDELSKRQTDMLKAFAAPISCLVEVHGEDRIMLAAAARANVPAIGTELGGGGTTSLESISVAVQGVDRVLRHLGFTPDRGGGEPTHANRLMEICGSDYFVYSPDYGIWEPLADLGDDVQQGQPAAKVFFPTMPWRQPVLAHFQHDGTVLCKRTPGAVERGDCLFHLATECVE